MQLAYITKIMVSPTKLIMDLTVLYFQLQAKTNIYWIGVAPKQWHQILVGITTVTVIPCERYMEAAADNSS